jgi:hypothetical protein
MVISSSVLSLYYILHIITAVPLKKYLIFINILWRICPLLGNGLVNTFPKHTLSIGHPLLGNGLITHSWEQETVFSVRSVPRNFKRTDSGELQKYGKVERSMREYNGVVEVRIVSAECPVGRRQCIRQWFVDIFNQFYEGPINSVIQSKTHLICHANSGYVTICILACSNFIEILDWDWL